MQIANAPARSWVNLGVNCAQARLIFRLFHILLHFNSEHFLFGFCYSESGLIWNILRMQKRYWLEIYH